MRHKSGHTISTRDFSDKLTSDLNSPSYLAVKNKVMFLKQTFTYILVMGIKIYQANSKWMSCHALAVSYWSISEVINHTFQSF